MKEDGSVSVVNEENIELYAMQEKGFSPAGTLVDFSYSMQGDVLSVTWSDDIEAITPPPGMVAPMISKAEIGCYLAMAGMALGTIGFIVATAGTAAAFGFAGASYVVSVGGVVVGCY